MTAGLSLEGQLMYTHPKYKPDPSAEPVMAVPEVNPLQIEDRVALPQDRRIFEWEDAKVWPKSIAEYAEQTQLAEEFYELWMREIASDLL